MINLRSKRTYQVRDYAGSEPTDPDDYKVVLSGATWERAQKWVDQNTTEETAGVYAIHADDPPPFHFVCVVLRDRAYGGPEEGGWWYDTYNPDDHEAKWLTHEAGGPWLTTNKADALRMHHRLNIILREARVNDERPYVNSVLSRGVYEAHLFDGYPHYIPREVPRYE